MPRHEADDTPTAVDALARLAGQGRALCPGDADPEGRAGETLGELARLAQLLDGAVESVSGRRNETVGEHDAALASVISAHRNLALGPGPSPTP